MNNTAPSTIRVLLVDDHPVLRSGLTRIISMERGLQVVEAASSGADAVIAWKQHKPDVGVIDLFMPVMDGVETILSIRRIDPEARLLMLSSSEHAIDATRAEQAGACGYLTKQADAETIATAIRQAHAGGQRIRAGRLLGPAAPKLSPREMEVLALLKDGRSNEEIGEQLGISDQTVKTHLRALREKLGAADRAGAVGKAFELGLLKPADRR
jgi:two-component system NarL family response regulator